MLFHDIMKTCRLANHIKKSIGLICCLVFFTSVIRAQNVTTYAGTLGVQGLVNGYKDTCQFAGAEQMAFDSHGNLFIADFQNSVIRKIDTAGNVSTFAGTAGATGFVNGYKDTCKFGLPIGIAVDKFDNIYVADNSNNAIRKIDTAGNVTTFAGGSQGYTNGSGSIAQFRNPVYICFDDSMNLYVTDNQNHAIRRIDSAGNVTTFAGAGFAGWADGNGENAYFSRPFAITYNSLLQTFYVVDRGFCFIRKITLTGDVTTIAGTGFCGFNNGAGDTAMFDEPKGIATDSIGNIYIAGRLDHTIRKIDLLNNVSTFAGVPNTSGYQDGPAATAMFNRPISVTVGPKNQLFISDAYNYLIRKINLNLSKDDVPFIPGALAFSVYPNPSSNLIQIEGLTTNKRSILEIYNPVGQKILSKKISDTSDLRLDIQDLMPGVYFIKIMSGNSQGVVRFIKQ